MRGFAQCAPSRDTPARGYETRLRSEGILSAEHCAMHVGNLAYDPMQMGWVPADVIDDLCHHQTPPKSPLRVVPSDIRLRAWSKTDAPRYQELLDDPMIWAQMPEDYPDPLTRDLADTLIDIANDSNHHRVFAVLKDDVPVGQVRIAFADDAADTYEAEISYWIGRDYWGQGLGSAAVATLAAQCLRDHPGLTTVVARVKDGNAASLRVLEKAGFSQCGPDALPGWMRLQRLRD